MRVQVVDGGALDSPAPRSIRLYLQMHGWQRQAEPQRIPDVWALPTEDGTYEVIAPSSREARDFRPRVAELLRTLAIAEDRSELDVFRDLTRVQFDIQYIHTLLGTARGSTAA